MGLLPYAASDVLRNRRRTVSAILGVLLAVTFVAGTFIAIDSSARATLDATLVGIQGDFNFYRSTSDPNFNYTDLENVLLSSAGVINASLYRNLPVMTIENVSGSSPYPCCLTTYAIDPGHPPSFLRDATVTGSLELPPQAIGLTKELAAFLNVDIGDRVVAVYQVNETIRWTANLTVGSLVELSSTVSGYYGDVITPGPPYLYGSFAFVHLRDVSWLLSQLNQTESYGFQVIGEVWIDRAHYVNPYDIDATQRSLLRIQHRLEAILGPNAYVVDNILTRIEDFSNRIAVQRIQYLLLSMPVVLLGVYLGAVGVDLSHAERRRELAVLKTRGARGRQLIGLLIFEAIVGGLIAAVVGLVFGVGLSRFLLGVVNPGTAPPYEAFILTTNTILAVPFLSMVLMGLVAYRSSKRTAGLSIVETLRFYAPGETKLQYSPRTDIILVTVGVADYILVWFRGGAPTNLWTFLLGFVPFLLLPFVPLLLIIGLTRLLTRSTGKVYDWFSRAAKPFTKDLYYVIRRNLMRNPRRSANVAIIIALGLAFGVFSLSILATNAAHQEREVRASVGADMAVFAGGSALNQSGDIAANLSAIPGVAGVTRVLSFSVNVQYGGVVYGLEPDSYFAVAQPEGWYFAAGNPTNAHDVLGRSGQVLVSQSYADQAALEVGDLLILSATVYDQNGTFQGTIQDNVTVGGIVRYLPGVGYGPFQSSVYANVATLRPFMSADRSRNFSSLDRYLVDIAPGGDWRTVKAAVLQVSNVSFVSVAPEQVELLNTNPFARAIYGFIAMEISFIVVILTAGVGLILFAASLERDAEFAAIIARGSSGWQTAKLLVGEAFVIMLVGLSIGVGVGLVTAFFATQWLATGPSGTPTSAVPYFFVFPWDAFLLVVLAPAAMLLSAVLVSARTARMNIAKVLKLRGG